jgi:hypothetical protein
MTETTTTITTTTTNRELSKQPPLKTHKSREPSTRLPNPKIPKTPRKKLTLQHHPPHPSHLLPLPPLFPRSSPKQLASRLYRLNISSKTPASARALLSSSADTSGLGKWSRGRAVYLASVAARRAATNWTPVPGQRGIGAPKRRVERVESIFCVVGVVVG